MFIVDVLPPDENSCNMWVARFLYYGLTFFYAEKAEGESREEAIHELRKSLAEVYPKGLPSKINEALQ